MPLSVHITKKLAGFSLNVNFDTEDETVALFGASGCGKSMTLKCIAGIVRPDSGRIVLNGRTLFDSEKKINLPPQKRHTGYLFQNYALFPNMTVHQNIMTAMKRDGKKDPALADQILKKMDITDQAGKYPHQLSGGQQQRVALARILVSSPEIILLDEPFSALDTHMRFQMEMLTRDIIKTFPKPVLFVSHSRDEVFRLSDKVLLIEDGYGSGCRNFGELMAHPKTYTQAQLFGCRNIAPVKMTGEHTACADNWGFAFTSKKLNNDVRYVGIHMDAVSISEEISDAAWQMQVHEIIDDMDGRLLVLEKEGRPESRFFIKMNDCSILPEKGSTVSVRVDEEKILLLK